MIRIMTEVEHVDIDQSIPPVTITANGHDLESLLFSFLDEFLAVFTTEDYICTDIHIDEFNKDTFTILAKGYGEKFSLNKHPQGTEVKAITYSNMQV